jgi:hypothetical protein
VRHGALVGEEAVTDEDKKRQAEVLAMIAKLPKDATIADFNRLRLMSSIIIPEKQKVH